MSIFGWMDANDDGIPDNMLYYDLCTGGKATRAAAAQKKGSAAGGGLDLRKVRKIQSGHVPDSLRHPSDPSGRGSGSSRPR